MIKIKISIQGWLLIAANVIIAIFAVVKPELRLILLTLLLWGDLIVYTLNDLEKRAPMLAFLISFFTFLIGREALERLGMHTVETPFPETINRHAEKLVLMSLIFFTFGYAFSGRAKNKQLVTMRYNSEQYRSVRYVSKVLFYMTYAFNLFVVLDMVYFVLTRGYATFFSSYVSHVPYILKKVGDMSPILFWIYLSTYPQKKECKYPILFYVFYLMLSLGTGMRFVFVAGVLTLFVYFVLRNNNKGDVRCWGEPEVWFSKKHMVFAVAFVPVLIVSMFFINLIRFGRNVDGVKLMDAFTGFFYGQGVSINFVKRAKMYERLLPENKWYMFGKTLDFLSDNIIARSFGTVTYRGNTADQALHGNQLSHALSYRVMGDHYLNGHGLGSSYVAELYHDLRYWGIALGNILYGVIFKRVFRFENKGIWATAICFFMLNSLMHAGRGNFDSFLTDILDMTTWGTIIIVVLLSKLHMSFIRERRASV